MGASPTMGHTASLIGAQPGAQPYQYNTATGERGGKRRRSDGPLGPAGVAAFLHPKASSVTFDPYLGQSPPGALFNQQFTASPLAAGGPTPAADRCQIYPELAPGDGGFTLPTPDDSSQQQLVLGMPGNTPAAAPAPALHAASLHDASLRPAVAVGSAAATLPGPVNTAAAAEGPGGSLSSFADELLGVGDGGGSGGGLDQQWLEDIDPSWLDPSSGFDAELEMGVPEIFNAS